MTRVFYLVSPSIEAGVLEAHIRGWRAIGRARFVTQDNDDVRLVTRFDELVPLHGMKTPMVKGAGYEDEPVENHRREQWSAAKSRFDDAVATGQAEWVER